MLTAKHLITRTPSKISYRASYPKVRIIKDFTKKNEEYRGVFAHVALGNTESTGDTYALTIRCHGTKKDPANFYLNPESLVWVHCSCPYFTYHLEVALKLRGSSEIRNSNGNLPRIKNPNLKPYLCKHLYALMLYTIAVDKSTVEKNLRKQKMQERTTGVGRPSKGLRNPKTTVRKPPNKTTSPKPVPTKTLRKPPTKTAKKPGGRRR